MKHFTLLLLSAFFLSSMNGQPLQEMKPALGKLVDKSPEKEIEFIKAQERCEAVWKKIKNPGDYDKLSAAEKKIYDNCSEEFEGYWDIIGNGCSWYCGGGMDTVSASSELKQYRGIKYSAKNAHDLNYKTVWVEGVSGYGIGEYLLYHFPPENPRITNIIVVNGYVKSEKTWRENSRVKKLKMYLNDKPYAILHLADTRQEQSFSFKPIGYSRDADLHTKPWWTIKFEIMEVYEGEKYDDTAITEIYFDGIDVH